MEIPKIHSEDSRVKIDTVAFEQLMGAYPNLTRNLKTVEVVRGIVDKDDDLRVFGDYSPTECRVRIYSDAYAQQRPPRKLGLDQVLLHEVGHAANRQKDEVAKYSYSAIMAIGMLGSIALSFSLTPVREMQIPPHWVIGCSGMCSAIPLTILTFAAHHAITVPIAERRAHQFFLKNKDDSRWANIIQFSE